MQPEPGHPHPRSVARPAPSTAPIDPRTARAAAIAPTGGASSSASPSAVGSPQQAARRAKSARSAILISGEGNRARLPSSASAQQRYTTPKSSRPDRPARWVAAAVDTGTVASDPRPRA